MLSAFIFVAMNTPRTVEPAARPFPLSAVTILPGLQRTRLEADRKYLLSLDPIRLMHGFYVNAGIKPKADRYGGWEGMGIEGHSLGHYLSACALMFGATQDEAFKARCEQIVTELAECQRAKGSGFIGGMPDAQRIFTELQARNIRSQGFDLNGNWVPWYNIHKTLAGLLDSYHTVGLKAALPVLEANAEWIHNLTKDYTDADWQKMLACEHGGMNESLADLYSITKNPMHLELARKFFHKAILDPLEKGERKLAGKHGNTQIPKIIGTARLFEVTGETAYRDVSKNFWSEVREDHTYAMGGHGMGEHFGPAKKLNDRLSDSNAETCNSYNMLKLTDHLMQWSPTVEGGDFAERVLVNHILTSEDLATGGVTYFIPLRPGGRKDYSGAFDNFTCCRGTGMENHAKYGEGIYYYQADQLWISQYVPSKLNWRQKGVTVTTKTNYPQSEEVEFTVESKEPQHLSLTFRCPSWAVDGVTLSGEFGEKKGKAGEWLTLSRSFYGTETFKLRIPMKLRAEPMPDNPKRVAMMYGPTTLVAQWPEKPSLAAGNVERTPVFIASDAPVQSWLKRQPGGNWQTTGNMLPGDLTFRPFYDIQHERYSAYLDVFTKSEWDAREADYRTQEEQAADLRRRTVDFFVPGEMQSERDHSVTSKESSPGEFNGRKYRHAMNNGFFAFDLKVDPNVESDLLFTYWGGDRRTFDVLIDGEKLETVKQPGGQSKFVEKAYPLTKAFLHGRTKITVRFQAPADNWAGGLYGARIVRRKS